MTRYFVLRSHNDNDKVWLFTQFLLFDRSFQFDCDCYFVTSSSVFSSLSVIRPSDPLVGWSSCISPFLSFFREKSKISHKLTKSVPLYQTSPWWCRQCSGYIGIIFNKNISDDKFWSVRWRVITGVINYLSNFKQRTYFVYCRKKSKYIDILQISYNRKCEAELRFLFSLFE